MADAKHLRMLARVVLPSLNSFPASLGSRHCLFYSPLRCFASTRDDTTNANSDDTSNDRPETKGPGILKRHPMSGEPFSTYRLGAEINFKESGTWEEKVGDVLKVGPYSKLGNLKDGFDQGPGMVAWKELPPSVPEFGKNARNMSDGVQMAGSGSDTSQVKLQKLAVSEIAEAEDSKATQESWTKFLRKFVDTDKGGGGGTRKEMWKKVMEEGQQRSNEVTDPSIPPLEGYISFLRNLPDISKRSGGEALKNKLKKKLLEEGQQQSNDAIDPSLVTPMAEESIGSGYHDDSFKEQAGISTVVRSNHEAKDNPQNGTLLSGAQPGRAFERTWTTKDQTGSFFERAWAHTVEDQPHTGTVLSETGTAWTYGVFLPGLPHGTTVDDLEAALRPFGELTNARVNAAMDPAGRSFGHVYFKELSALDSAVSQGFIRMKGQEVEIRVAKNTAGLLRSSINRVLGQQERMAQNFMLEKDRPKAVGLLRSSLPSSSRIQTGSSPGNTGGSSNAVLLPNVPSTASLQLFQSVLGQFGPIHSVAIHPSEEAAEGSDVTVCFKSIEARNAALLQKEIVLLNKVVPVKFLRGDRTLTNPVFQFVRSSEGDAATLTALRAACSRVAPVRSFRPRSSSAVDVLFEEKEDISSITLGLERMQIQGWRCSLISKPADFGTTELHVQGDRQGSRGRSWSKGLLHCELLLQRCISNIKAMRDAEDNKE